MTESLAFRGYLSGHSGWVTAIATNPSNPGILVTASRDKTIIVWQLTRDENSFGVPKRILRGHNHFVSDVEISMDGQYALSSSWDKTLRLWDLNTGKTTQRFVGHDKEVLSVSFSATNRQIVSGSIDKSVKIWNTIGDVKLDLKEGGHESWVTKVRFSPGSENPVIVTAGHDKVVKVWDLATGKLKIDHFRHTGTINAITISPDGSLCASGGKDGVSLLWDLNDSKYLYRIDAGDEINALVFSPNRYWLCAATSRAVKIFDLESKNTVATLKPDVVPGPRGREPQAISLAWSSDGFNLFVGYTDNEVRIYTVI